jgi:RNA ligase
MIEELKKLESEGYVRSVKHKELPLTIWNYTPKTQYEKAFGDFPILRSCRGLVLDDEGKIWARPFSKFHNYEEHELSEFPFGQDIEVTLKMDGSLLIVFKYGEEVVYATRGSFYSDQAIAGGELFRELYDEGIIENGLTYLFELIGPDNRIVVSYEKNDLVHLALLDTTNGHDLPRDERFKCVKVYEVEGGKLDSDCSIFGSKVYQTLNSLNTANEEGFVIRAIGNEFKPDWRCKIKFSEYCRLHSIVTKISNRDVWEYLRDNRSFDEIIEVCPDEFCNWLKQTKHNLENEYEVVLAKANLVFGFIKNIESRREQALELISNHKDVSHIVFNMLDGKSYTEIIWDMVKPSKFVQPFSNKGQLPTTKVFGLLQSE